MQFTFIISMIFAVIIAFFAVANSEPVTINLIFKSFELSQAVVILVSAVIGAVIVFMLSLVSRAKAAMKSKTLNKELTYTKNQLVQCQTDLEKIKNENAEKSVVESTPETQVEEKVVQ
jgi:uncharacterized integral membrane protein